MNNISTIITLFLVAVETIELLSAEMMFEFCIFEFTILVFGAFNSFNMIIRAAFACCIFNWFSVLPSLFSFENYATLVFIKSLTYDKSLSSKFIFAFKETRLLMYSCLIDFTSFKDNCWNCPWACRKFTNDHWPMQFLEKKLLFCTSVLILIDFQYCYRLL